MRKPHMLRVVPKSDFYSGLPLAEQIEKLAEHHSDRSVRHISQDEAEILNRAVVALKVGIPRTVRRREYDEEWRQLDHMYETRIWSPQSEYLLIATSVPLRSREVSAQSAGEIFPADWVVAEAPANPRLVQLALNIVFSHVIDETINLESMWNEQAQRRSPPRHESLGDIENALLNRALYQHTIAVEQSPPTFTSVSKVLDKATGPTLIAVVAANTGNPAAVLRTAGLILLITFSRTVASGAAQGLSAGLYERLYEWSRPRHHEHPPTGGA